MRKFDKRLSFRVDALNQRIDQIASMPKSKMRSKALLQLRERLRKVEEKIPTQQCKEGE